MKTIHHVVEIDAPATKVWAAISEQSGLAGWWSTRVVASSATVGGRVAFTFLPGFNPEFEITNVEPGEELEWRFVGGHEPWIDNTFRFQLVPLDGGRTKLRFWQFYAVELSDDAYGNYNFRWGYYLDSLRMLVTTGAGKPHVPGA